MSKSAVVYRFPGNLTQFGLLLFAFSIPVSHVPAQFGIGFAVLGWLLDGFLNKQWQIQWNPLFLPLILYLGWNVLCSAVSPRPAHSLFAVVDNEWALFIMLMMVWTVKDTKTLHRILIAWFISSSVAMVYAIWETFAGVELYRGRVLDPMGNFFRSVGFYGFYLTFAAFAMTVFFLSTVYAIERGSKGRVYRFVLPALSFAAVLFTFARSIWLSFVGILPLLGFVRGKGKDWMWSIAALVLFGMALLAVPTLRERAESTFDVKANETRINLWETSLRISKDFRFVGIGEDNFDYYFDKYKVPGFYDTTAHPHNDYLNVLINAGVPGLTFFLWIWMVALRSGILTWRGTRDPLIRTVALGGALSLAGFMIGALFQDYYGSFINCLGWWFVVGLILTGEKLGRNLKDVAAVSADTQNQIST